MDDATVAMLEVEARVIYEGCAPDMDGWDLDESAAFVGDRLYDEYHDSYPNVRFFPIAREAIKGYF